MKNSKRRKEILGLIIILAYHNESAPKPKEFKLNFTVTKVHLLMPPMM